MPDAVLDKAMNVEMLTGVWCSRPTARRAGRRKLIAMVRQSGLAGEKGVDRAGTTLERVCKVLQ